MANMFQQLQSSYNPNANYFGESPMGSFPEMNLMNSSTGYLAQTSGQYKDAANYSGVLYDNEQRAAEAARQKKIDELSQMKQSIESKDYKKIWKESGGFDFFDPLGNKITVNDYAKAMGTTPIKAISDSMDPRDMQKVADYQYLSSILTALNKKDPKSYDEIIKKLRKTKGIDISKLTIRQLIDAYQQTYPELFTDKGTVDASMYGYEDM
jgi:hypothetical protein